MKPGWDILRAMPNCSYKAWRLARNDSASIDLQITGSEAEITLPVQELNPKDKLAVIALCQASVQTIERVNIHYGLSETVSFKIPKQAKLAQKLLIDAQSIIDKTEPPPFYLNSHCPACQFREDCYQKLKEKDCISLLGGISPKILSKYHKKGIFSVTQLSHTFRPRRRRSRAVKHASKFLWELKALAIREQKTFVMNTPELDEDPTVIYLDFEGVPNEDFVYLLGGIVKQEGKPDELFSFWADGKDKEKQIFTQLFDLLGRYPSAPVYHYGSYESKVLKQAVKQWAGRFKQELPKIEERTVNLLGYLRTHVYPPIYSNGLKELAGYLGFQWQDPEASGLLSLTWHRNWEITNEDDWKEKLIRYNQDDCHALERVAQWFRQLASDAEMEGVQQVAEMKKQSPYRFHDNPEFGDDFQYINKAGYFDYQRKKIYWRNKKAPAPIPTSREYYLNKHPGKGTVAWKPKKVNEIVIAPPLKKCPKCGHEKLYFSKKRNSFKQTDIKFTSSGIRQWVREHQSALAKCAKCNNKCSNRNMRMLLYGDNLFAWAINMYVNYHISHVMVSRMLQEQISVWMNPMYLIQRKYKWWRQWEPEVNYLWEIIRHSPVIHIDETNVRLSREKGYVWVFATPHTVFYHLTLSHEADFLHTWLKGYQGVIVTDFFPNYESIPVKRQKCMVHLIRDLNDDLFKNPFDDEYKNLVEAFGKLLREIIETVDRYGLKKRHLQKHLKDTDGFFKQFIEVKYKSELSLKYVKRLRKHWNQLWTFLQHDDVPWNNNNAEAAIKAFAQYRRGVNGQVTEKGMREYLEMLSISQTCRYRNISFLDFLRRKSGIWDNIEPEALPSFLPFPQARLFVQRLGFERRLQWTIWKSEGKRPPFIPSSPERVYKDKGWVDWHDWIGFSFMPFEEARTYMRKLGLKNREAYWAWLKSGKRPKTIPGDPKDVYKHTGWKDLSDWLGNNNTGPKKKKRMTYQQAKTYIQALGIKTQKEFFEWRKSGSRPDTFPSELYKTYGHEFEGWGKFLGTDRIANQDKKNVFWDHTQAKAFLKPLYVRSIQHFRQLHAMGVIPKEIPRNPMSYYKKQGTWLGASDFWSKSLT